jgi:hypothetical protein
VAEKVDCLTAEQAAQLPAHAHRWARIGLRTAAADRPAFEAAARRCYEHAGVPWHGHVVWVDSPLVLLIAAPAAAYLWEMGLGERTRETLAGCVRRAFKRGVAEGICEALRNSLVPACAPDGGGTSRSPIARLLRRAVRRIGSAAPRSRQAAGDRNGLSIGPAILDSFFASYVRTRQAIGQKAWVAAMDAYTRAQQDSASIRNTLVAATLSAWDELQDEAGSRLVSDIKRRCLRPTATRVPGGPLDTGRFLSGQLELQLRAWTAYATSYFRDVCALELPGNMSHRALAYEQTLQSACCWYPHRDFVMVCDRPREIHLEPVSPAGLRQETPPQGHWPHRADGPAISWPDGWGVHALHGRQVPGWIVEHPESITVASIESERSAEVRRIMLERYGWARYIAGCAPRVVDRVPMDHEIAGLRGARLLCKELPGEPEPIVYLDMVNSTPEPDGTCRHYLERIDPRAYRGEAARSCHAAMASRWHHRDESGQLRRTFEHWEDYRPHAES